MSVKPLSPTNVYPCPRCAQVGMDEPPHHDKPCPIVADEHEREQRRRDEANVAYVQMLDAQRMSYIRAPGANDEAVRLLRKFAGEEESE